MKEQYENLFAHLREVTEAAQVRQEKERQEEFEASWHKLKEKLEDCANKGRTFCTIRVAAYGGWETPLFRNLKEVMWRLKIIGFSDKQLETNLISYLEISWGDEE